MKQDLQPTHTPRLGTLRNGGKATPITPEMRAKGLETRRKRAEEKRRKAEEKALDVYASAAKTAALAHVDALYAERDESPDHQTRIAAADRVIDRILGKPVARTETTHTGRVEVDVEAKLLALLARGDDTPSGPSS